MRLRRHPAGPAADRRVVWQAASLLLAYPDEAFAQRLSLVDAALDTLPPAAREPLRQCVSRLTALDPMDASVKYVDTFDWRRRRTLFLTYYTAGDTRGRGMALLEFATVYRAAGAVPPPGELPDHLAVVLEFAATVDEEAGYRLLATHRTSIDLLLDGLRKMDSPYAAVVDAVAATLPAPSEQDLLRARRVAMQGPPAEAVGLDPYPMPGTGPSRTPGPIPLELTPNPRVLAGKGMS
ncbi:MAG TPA: nitrate reductase molybdenum cofactor assembly chaperone [Nakamurella sp.]